MENLALAEGTQALAPGDAGNYWCMKVQPRGPGRKPTCAQGCGLREGQCLCNVFQQLHSYMP